MWVNIELNEKNYGVIGFSIGFNDTMKYHLNSSANSFWDDNKLHNLIF